MKKHKNIKRVCALDTMYTLLQYLLISTEEEINSTFFFFFFFLDDNIKHYFKNKSATFRNEMSFWEILILYYIETPIKWPFLLRNDVRRFCSDHIGFESIVARRKPFELLEDGLLCYVDNYPVVWENRRLHGIKKFLLGPVFASHQKIGEEKTCIKIHLTGLKDADILRDSRAVIQSFPSLWNKSSPSKKNKILEIFGINREMLEGLRGKKWIIVTQPFSEGNVISEESKIKIYKKIVDFIHDDTSVVIKPHPREKTDYEKYFPGVIVFKSKAPIQLFSLCGIQFENICTVCSTAAYGFPYDYNLYYFGTEIDPILNEKIPDGRLSNIGTLPPNINLCNKHSI